MALTVNTSPALFNKSGLYSSASLKPVLLVGDTSYPGTGYVVSKTTFGFINQFLGIVTDAQAQAQNGYFCQYDVVNNSIRFYNWGAPSGTSATEVASTTSLAAVQVFCFAVGY